MVEKMTNNKSIMENKLLRLCNKIYKSHFNLADVIVLLEDDSCTLNCLNRNHTVFFEMDVDLDYFQGAYEPTNRMHCILPEDIINMELDLDREITEFQQAHILSLQRLHHFFCEDTHHVPFKNFKKIAESECDKVEIVCNDDRSMFISNYLREPLLDIPDTFGLNLHGEDNPVYLMYIYDFFTVKAIIASRVTPIEEAEIIFEVEVDMDD